MRAVSIRVVLDTNILVRAMLNEQSDSSKILRVCEGRRIVPVVSKGIVAEYRAILSRPSLVENYPDFLTPRRVKEVLRRLLYLADKAPSRPIRFEFSRDPKDALVIDLAILGRATHLITTDHDLLDLGHQWGGAARRLRRTSPTLEIVKPNEFVATHTELFV